MTIRRLYILALCATAGFVAAGRAVAAENTQVRNQRFDLVEPDEHEAAYGTFTSIGGTGSTGGTGPYGDYVAESPGEAVTHAATQAAATWTTAHVKRREVIRPFDAAHVPVPLDDAPLSKIRLPEPDTPDDTFPEDRIDIAAMLGIGAAKPEDDSPVQLKDFFPNFLSAFAVALLGAVAGLGITYWRVTRGQVQRPRKPPRVIK